MEYSDVILNKLDEKFKEFSDSLEEAVNTAKEKGEKIPPPDWFDLDKKLGRLYTVVQYLVDCDMIDNKEEWEHFKSDVHPKCKKWIKVLDNPEIKPTQKEVSIWMFKTISDPKMLEKLGKSLNLIVDGVQITDTEQPKPEQKGEKASEEDWN